jgi:hypothetical protein
MNATKYTAEKVQRPSAALAELEQHVRAFVRNPTFMGTVLEEGRVVVALDVEGYRPAGVTVAGPRYLFVTEAKDAISICRALGQRAAAEMFAQTAPFGETWLFLARGAVGGAIHFFRGTISRGGSPS